MVTYRLAQPADRTAIEEIFCQLQDFERTIEPNRADSVAIRGDYVDRLLAECAEHAGAMFVAEFEGRVVGFVCVLGQVDSGDIIESDREYAYVTDLCVAKEHRCTGIGTQLMLLAEEHARKCAMRRLMVGVLAANVTAYRFYRKIEFKETEIVLEKFLDPQ